MCNIKRLETIKKERTEFAKIATNDRKKEVAHQNLKACGILSSNGNLNKAYKEVFGVIER